MAAKVDKRKLCADCGAELYASTARVVSDIYPQGFDESFCESDLVCDTCLSAFQCELVAQVMEKKHG